MSEWKDVIFPNGGLNSYAEVGSRLGVPFTRTLFPTVDIKLTSEPTTEGSNNSHVVHRFEVSQDSMGALGISGVVWDAGMYLLDFLISQQKYTSTEAGRLKLDKVLDLGCGTGICGLGALLLGATDVAFSDQVIMDCLEENVTKLSPEQLQRVKCIKWKWSHVEGSTPDELLQGPESPWSVVLCSDVLYDSTAHESLLYVLHHIHFEILIISYKKRHEVEELLFLEKISEWCTLSVIPKEEILSINLPPKISNDQSMFIIVATRKGSL